MQTLSQVCAPVHVKYKQKFRPDYNTSNDSNYIVVAPQYGDLMGDSTWESLLVTKLKLCSFMWKQCVSSRKYFGRINTWVLIQLSLAKNNCKVSGGAKSISSLDGELCIRGRTYELPGLPSL